MLSASGLDAGCFCYRGGIRFERGTFLLLVACLAAGFLAGRLTAPDAESPRSDPDRKGAVPPDERPSPALTHHGPGVAEVAEVEAARPSRTEREATRDNVRFVAPRDWLRRLAPGKFGDLSVDELKYMRELDLSGLEVSDDDLALLAGLPSLRTLTLRRTQVGDAGLVHLAKIENLERLGLRETQVTDAGMGRIPALKSLTHLDLNLLPVTDGGLALIRGMARLEFVRLNYTKVTDTGLSYLTQLPALQRLDLWALDISDKGVEQLWHLPALNHLELGATPISKEWVERFQAAHPECYVRSRWGR